MTHPIEKLDVNQVAALMRWKWFYGRGWKAELNRAWQTGRYSDAFGSDTTCLLQQIRNRIGPSGLAKIKLD